tara:strand:- start:12798 stop:13280 length:483 start_codon:yes stop_codon:yes gene_type:complete
MKYIKSIFVMLCISTILAFSTQAELHSDTYIGNGRTFVNIVKHIERGGKKYPLFYTSKEDVYAFSFDYVVAEMKNMEKAEAIAKKYGVKLTAYNDLQIALFIADSPMEVMDLYKKLKTEPMIEYLELALFEAHPDMKKYVVKLPGVETPIGNVMLWFDKW